MTSIHRESKSKPVSTGVTLLDRDQSTLAFNARVFDWARRKDVPLRERLRYLCIVSSNLDEFFDVRVEPHLVACQRKDEEGLFSVSSFERIADAAHALVARQHAVYNDDLMPALEAQGIKIVSHGERNVAQRRWVKQYFERDWMNRNMMRRVELAWQVTDRVQRQRIVDEELVAYLHDGVDAWELCPDGSYTRVKVPGRGQRHSAQSALMARYADQDETGGD